MFRVIIVSLCIALTLTACGTSVRSKKVKALQRKDKLLTCKEILLEMNEAEFYRSTAERNKGPSMKSVLMPLGYISTYMDAEEAIKAAAARVDYLDRVYQIMDCDVAENQGLLGGSNIFPSFGGNNDVKKPEMRPGSPPPTWVSPQAIAPAAVVAPQVQPVVAAPPQQTGYAPFVQPR